MRYILISDTFITFIYLLINLNGLVLGKYKSTDLIWSVFLRNRIYIFVVHTSTLIQYPV